MKERERDKGAYIKGKNLLQWVPLPNPVGKPSRYRGGGKELNIFLGGYAPGGWGEGATKKRGRLPFGRQNLAFPILTFGAGWGVGGEESHQKAAGVVL